MKIYLIEIPGFGIALMKSESLDEVKDLMEEIEFEDAGKCFKAKVSSITEIKFENKINLLIQRLDPKPYRE